MYNQDKSFQPLENMISNTCSKAQYDHSLHTIVYALNRTYICCLGELYCKFIKPNKKWMCCDIICIKKKSKSTAKYSL